MPIHTVASVRAFPCCVARQLRQPFAEDGVRVQNQPNLCSSIAWMKNLHTMSVVVRGFPPFETTTSRSLASSHLSMVSEAQAALAFERPVEALHTVEFGIPVILV